MDIEETAERIRTGDRRALARAITLAESSRADHRERAEALLAVLLPATGGSVRLGISGPPGVGKSSFIEAFGSRLIEEGHRVAVLAIDPSSRVTGGSILGDKTRMERLARSPEAFVRPSPTGGSLGGVARRTREALLLCEAAGFDVTIVETVGVGQSETAVADMVDLFLLLLPPAGGDELQGIKKGVVELADLVVVNKADGDLLASARRAAAEYQSALRMLRPTTADWQVPVLQVSAREERGLDEVWQAVGRFRAALGEAGLARKRAAQARAWMWSEIDDSLIRAFRAHPAVAARLAEAEAAVSEGRQPAATAARELLAAFLGRT
ncbi:methylmalonyl-CoA mutase metallochaperone MeaB [Tistlia consotensis]|uniref:Methylmalonyl-CoA mutase metallochaperone MeaB n=1 Tax=Tistlia consotensis USBA 355 TaxID=560819 RepID=A0A1Y6C0P2_9PROT|nr:methylmalonyl Co-A mutase-associated GTPase MeaB [Tistlia consotensis]SMF39394.1 methylmalonyl-CoA mutase metallochaperone MeaB [Tistlia consotensis USBA 355]SNR36412.1 methylmalonyl-CoA mutase metallochaperone MeaB [Tistlia consotensis]